MLEKAVRNKNGLRFEAVSGIDKVKEELYRRYEEFSKGRELY